jgi:hypothetical protein
LVVVEVLLNNRKLVVEATDPARPSLTPGAPEGPTRAPLLPLMVPAVMTPAMAPVHTAPEGQQATWPAWSGAQTAFARQQRPGAPRAAQERKSFGHALLLLLLVSWRFFSSSWAVAFWSCSGR